MYIKMGPVWLSMSLSILILSIHFQCPPFHHDLLIIFIDISQCFVFFYFVCMCPFRAILHFTACLDGDFANQMWRGNYGFN